MPALLSKSQSLHRRTIRGKKEISMFLIAGASAFAAISQPVKVIGGQVSGVVVDLLSPESVDRRWINFEAGFPRWEMVPGRSTSISRRAA